ncbi:SanA/YdcF family protein [Hamadaea tsunoensis]|uniref:SanA/YdcF family protein n=1 Tax=Hamadaea tsunoensis TaxID=53368 RepID=UPI00040DB113|nr:ElyC/SanA/YdcF family protein [Hamadaea tsunoensis]
MKMPSPRVRRWVVRVVLAALGAAVVLVAGSQIWIRAGASGHVYAEAGVPSRPVALVLGAQVNPDGTLSPFLEARVSAAMRLYQAGKVQAILVSGDHGEWKYDEPGHMHAWLVAHGVPDVKVVDDYAGFDTYDSCQRAVRIFGVTGAIVLTQSYHIDRAVTLCREAGMDAVGVGDDTARAFKDQWRNASVREQGAYLKAVFDTVTGRDPVYLGPHELGVAHALAAPR